MDERTFSHEVVKWRERAVATCLACGASVEEAEDVAQDVLLRLWQLREELNRYHSIEGLVVVMSRHELANIRRKDHNVPIMSINTSMLRSNLIHPDETLISSQEVKWLNSAMRELPSTQYVVLHMRQIENLSYDDIAERLGIESSTARSLLSRARIKLLEEIKKRNL